MTNIFYKTFLLVKFHRTKYLINYLFQKENKILIMNLPAFVSVALADYFLVIEACIDFLEKM